VLLGIFLASGGDIPAIPEDGEGAHPATMVVGLLVPVAMALVEWWLRPADAERPASRSGVVQVALLFTGGVCLMVGVLLDFVPLISLSLPFEIAAVAIFVKRNWASLRSVGWGERTASPYLAASSVAIVVNLGMLAYLLSQYADDFDATPRHLILALDHTMFIGVLTNALFGFLLVLTARRRATTAPWADRVVFALVNIGIAGFWVGFVLDEALPKRIFTPLMGTGILLGVAVFFLRTIEAPAVEPEARLPVPG
jgi:hypothetical protein